MPGDAHAGIDRIEFPVIPRAYPAYAAIQGRYVYVAADVPPIFRLPKKRAYEIVLHAFIFRRYKKRHRLIDIFKHYRLKPPLHCAYRTALRY